MHSVCNTYLMYLYIDNTAEGFLEKRAEHPNPNVSAIQMFHDAFYRYVTLIIVYKV